MTQQSPLDRTTARRQSWRAWAAQAAFALTALVGGVSVSGLGRPHVDQRTVAEALAAHGPDTTGAFARVMQEPTAAELAAKYQAKGYDVSAELASTIAAAAKRHGIAPEVAFGLVRTESGFSNKATSRVGAIGLSQLMPRTAAWIRPGTTARQLRDPAHNVDVGFAYLRTLVDRYDGDVSTALLAYNRGPATVDRILKKGGNPDNGYATAVLADVAR